MVLLFPGVHLRKNVSLKREPYVVSATAWKEGKEPEYILKLARSIETLRFVLAGAWTGRDFHRRFMERAGELVAKNRVAVLGAVEECELLSLYSQALVFVQAKADVGFGFPALEAAGQGCASVIPAGQGVSDLLKDGRGAFIVDEKDTISIVKILKEVAENSELAITMGLNAWKTAHDFSFEIHALKICDLARECNGTTLHQGLGVMVLPIGG